MAEELEGGSSVLVPWSDLPSPVLEIIYTYLSRTDQTNMSLVCRKWSKGFKSPAVWKSFAFDLRENMLHMKNCAIIKFARKYSHWFKHVEINYTADTRMDSYELWMTHFKTFLKILSSQSKLDSVVFNNYRNFFQYDCLGIAEFLASQHRLKRLEFHNGSVIFESAIELVKASIKNSRDYLSHLFLPSLVKFGRFPYPSEIWNYDSPNEQILPILISLPNLKMVVIDYAHILGEHANSHDVIEMLKNWQKRIVLRLRLFKVALNDNHKLKTLTDRDWRNLKQENPYLQVEIDISTDSILQQKTKQFVVPNMPIAGLSYGFGDTISRREVDEFLHHLLSCNTNEHLVYFCLNVGPTIPSLILTFIPFISSCKNLEVLELNAVRSMNLDFIRSNFDPFLISLLEKRPKSLQQFRFKILKKQQEINTLILEDLSVKFKPLFKSINIGLCIEIID